MKILLITTTFPTPMRPRQGAFNQVLVSALSAKHDVRVIAPIPWTQSLRNQADPSCDGRTLHPTYFYPPKIFRQHYHRFYWQSILGSIKHMEQRFIPDVVMAYWLHPDGAAAVRAAERYGVPSIVMSGGTDLKLLPLQKRRGTAVTRVLEAADRLIVVSHDLAAVAYRLGVPAAKVDVVYRGINRDCFYPVDQAEARAACDQASDSVVILWAGRFVDVKNPTMLLQAAVRWKHIWGDRLRVIMTGDGPLRSHLHQLRDRLELGDVVHFAGNLTQSELALRYNAADVTVLTSHSEGIPNVLLESIACETSFVATDVGGVSEIASPKIDRLIPDGDVQAFADAVIQHIQTSPSGRRAFVPTDPAGMADQMDAVIERVVTRGQATKKTTALSPGPMHSIPDLRQAFHEAPR